MVCFLCDILDIRRCTVKQYYITVLFTSVVAISGCDLGDVFEFDEDDIAQRISTIISEEYEENLESSTEESASKSAIKYSRKQSSGSFICGEEPDDRSLGSAVGDCLKLREIVLTGGGVQWFTSSPSKQLMNTWNYSASDESNNKDNTYAFIFDDYFNSQYEQFAAFRMDGEEVEQGKRWCQNLNKVRFAGQENWRLPSTSELEGLYSKSNDLFSNFGWPTGLGYWTSDSGDYYVNSFCFESGVVDEFSYEEDSYYVSCVTEPIL